MLATLLHTIASASRCSHKLSSAAFKWRRHWITDKAPCRPLQAGGGIVRCDRRADHYSDIEIGRNALGGIDCLSAADADDNFRIVRFRFHRQCVIADFVHSPGNSMHSPASPASEMAAEAHGQTFSLTTASHGASGLRKPLLLRSEPSSSRAFGPCRCCPGNPIVRNMSAS